MKSPIFLLVMATLIFSGCRSHKEMATSEVCVTNDSISTDLDSRTELKTEAFDFFDFSADDLQIIFKADSVKVGDSVIYNPEISTSSKKPKIQDTSGQKTEAKEEVEADIKSGSHSSINKASKEVKEVKRSSPWVLPATIIRLTVLSLTLLIFWYRRRHRL